jgi:peptidoglycan/LPS O-acetylase OafA/YrhL
MKGGLRADIQAMKRPSIGSADNNFALLRLAAASLVLVSHGFLLTGRDDPALGVGLETLGDLAVTGFFAISGFLVARSWCRDARLGPYVARRALRIVPALWVVVLVSAYGLGPLLTTLPVQDYLASGATHAYVAGNAVFHTTLYLPGVFDGNPHGSVNGSLWTLPMEVEAYLAVAAIGLLGAFRRPRFVVGLWALLLLLDAPLGPGHHPLIARFVSTTLAEHSVDRLATFFGAALLYVLRDRDLVRGRVLAPLALLWVAALGTPLEHLAGAVTIPYAVVFLAYRGPAAVRRLAPRTDVSYGIYLYGWPVEQAIRSLAGHGLRPLPMIALAAPATYLLALASWRFVEAPALRLRNRTSALRASPQPART